MLVHWTWVLIGLLFGGISGFLLGAWLTERLNAIAEAMDSLE